MYNLIPFCNIMCFSLAQDVGLSHICEGLLDQLEGQLITLVLWNNQLTQNGMTHLAKTLVGELIRLFVCILLYLKNNTYCSIYCWSSAI